MVLSIEAGERLCRLPFPVESKKRERLCMIRPPGYVIVYSTTRLNYLARTVWRSRGGACKGEAYKVDLWVPKLHLFKYRYSRLTAPPFFAFEFIRNRRGSRRSGMGCQTLVVFARKTHPLTLFIQLMTSATRTTETRINTEYMAPR